MKNRSAAIGQKSLLYTKAFREIAGTVTATILFERLEYWFKNSPKRIYKFLEPSPSHKRYTRGDSWTEELGFSKDEFRSAFDAIGIRYISYSAYAALDNPFVRKDGIEVLYCSYYDRTEGLTYYYRNHPLVNEKLEQLSQGAYRQSQHGHVGNADMVDSQNQPEHVGNANMLNEENPPEHVGNANMVGGGKQTADHVGNANMLKEQNQPDHIGIANVPYGQSQHGHVGDANFHHVNHDLNTTDKTHTQEKKGVGHQSKFPRPQIRQWVEWRLARGGPKCDSYVVSLARVKDGEADDEIERDWPKVQAWLDEQGSRKGAGNDIVLPGEDVPELLAELLQAIRAKINHQSFTTWFAPIEAMSRADHAIYLRAPSIVIRDRRLPKAEYRDWLVTNYADIIEEALTEIGLGECRFEFVIKQI